MKKKYCALIFLSLLFILSACAPATPAVTDTKESDTTETPAATSEPVTSEAPVVIETINIVSDGKTQYNIVYPASDAEVRRGVVSARNNYNDTHGVKLATGSDEKAPTGYEIIVGKTSRGTDFAGYDALVGNDALITVRDKNIFILSKTSEGAVNGFNFFCGYFTKGDVMSITSDTALKVTEAMGKVSPMQNTVEVKGLTKTYSFLHVTDVHMCLIDSDETQARKDYNAPRIGNFSSGGMTSAERFPYFFDFAEQMKYDAMILTGDITDQPSEANIALLKKELSESKTKCLYVVGNHDWCFSDDYWTAHAKETYLPKFADISGGDTSVQITEYEDLIILTVDNGMNTFRQEHVDALLACKEKGKPILLAMHLPISAPELSVASKKVWGNRDICIGPGGVGDNEISKQFISLVKDESTNVVAILCGHVHFSHLENIGNVPQFVTGASFDGTCRVLTLTPGK